MKTRMQLVFEDVVGSDCDIPVLKFRNTETGEETPNFTFDVKRSHSHSKWQIHFGENEKVPDGVEALFQKMVNAYEYELVYETYRSFEVDGEMLSKLIAHLIWLSKITCKEANISVSKKDERESVSYFSPKKKVIVSID